MGPRFPLSGESVMVVMDARSTKAKGTVHALEWAAKHVVRRGDTVIVFGVLSQKGDRNSCLPLNMGVAIPGIWERLELAIQGQAGDVTPREVQEEIERMREQYHNSMQPLYPQCKKNEVKLEVKLAFGYDPEQVTVEQAQSSNPRSIVLDRNLKYKLIMHRQVGCNSAIMKRKDVTTLMPSKAPPPEYSHVDSPLSDAAQQWECSSTHPPLDGSKKSGFQKSNSKTQNFIRFEFGQLGH